MRNLILAAALLPCCRTVDVSFPEPAPVPSVPEKPPPEAYEAVEACPDGDYVHSFEIFPDGQARVALRGPGTAVSVDATAVPIPGGAAVLTFDGSSEPLGFADGEALVLIDRRPDGSALLHWESWTPSCGIRPGEGP